MREHSILDLRMKAFNLQSKFIVKFKQTWGLREAVEELNVQIGHLCQSFINNRKLQNNAEAFNQPHRTLLNIKDELCDCFLSVCSIYEFYGIEQEQLINQNIQNKQIEELILELFVLSTQLLDSCLILQGIKPSLNRNEDIVFLKTYSVILSILEKISAIEQLDMGKEFDKMIEQTLLYLNGE